MLCPRLPRRKSKLHPLVAAIWLCSVAAHAQINLPGGIQVPPLPERALDVEQTVSGAVGQDLRNLADLRRLRIRELLRTNSSTLESGPRGMPVIRSEVVALSPTPEAVAAAQAAGFSVVREQTLDGLETRIVILKGPSGWSGPRALRRLRALDRDGVYDLNHVYFESGEAPTTVTLPALVPDNAPSTVRIGLIDSGIESEHPVFAPGSIHRHGCNEGIFPSAHGTAVASLLIGQSDLFHGASPGAGLYAADVYCGAPTGGAVDAVAEAFGWLAREKVPVINVSLVGPANVVLENVVKRVLARGHIVVAAVGNDGPAAAAMYPASYPGVVGVTAVDERHRALLEAARGKQVDFAAPGADMAAAAPPHSYAAVRGTSFAAPIVAGLLARSLHTPDPAAADQAVEQLRASALDLGSRGPDRVYGNGLVGEAVRVAPKLAELH